MSKKEDFIQYINNEYASKGESITLGGEALVFSKQLSSFGIPVLMMYIKGDFSRIAYEG